MHKLRVVKDELEEGGSVTTGETKKRVEGEKETVARLGRTSMLGVRRDGCDQPCGRCFLGGQPSRGFRERPQSGWILFVRGFGQ